MPPKRSSVAGPRRTARATAKKSTPNSGCKSTTTDASPKIPPSATAPISDDIAPLDVIAETTPLTSPETRKSSSRTARKSAAETSSSRNSTEGAFAPAAPGTPSDVITETACRTASVQTLPESPAGTIDETNLKNSEDSRDPISPDETIDERPSETDTFGAYAPANACETGQEIGPDSSRFSPTTKPRARTVLKKTVRVVKKVIKKKVPKRPDNVQTVSPNGESRKLEAENENENPNPIVSGTTEVENRNPGAPDSLLLENLILEPNGSLSSEVGKCTPDAAVSTQNENLSLACTASISVVVKNSDLNHSASMDVDNLEESEAANGTDKGSVDEKISRVRNSNLDGDKDNANQGEQAVYKAEAQLVGMQEDEFGDVKLNFEGGGGKKGAERMENCDVSALKEKDGMGDGLVLSGEMEALERRKRRKTEIFVGGLDKDAKEEDIRKVFQEAGDIVEVRLVMNDKTGKNKGFAFVRYASAVDAKKALAKFAKVEICGKQCGAVAVEGNDTIFLGNIDKTWKSEDIIKRLQEIGIEKIDKVTVVADPSNIERNRGFAFIELETTRDAQNAYRKLQKKDAFGKNQKVKVAWAEPLIEPDEEEMLKVKSVYAEYLPSSWDEEKVKDYFKRFGDIDSIVLARNLPSSKRKDFAIVHYTSREAALACIEAFNRNSLNDKDSKVNVKVSLAKPVHKGKQVKHVSNPVRKDPPKEMQKAAQSVVKPSQPTSIAKSASGSYVEMQSNSSATTAELVQLLREQASWKQPQRVLASGSTDLDYSYSSPSRKRLFSTLGDDLPYSDPRGYPRTRLESSFPAASTSGLFRGIGMTPLPNGHRQGSGYASGLLYGVEDYPTNFQTRGGAPYQGSNGLYRRY